MLDWDMDFEDDDDNEDAAVKTIKEEPRKEKKKKKKHEPEPTPVEDEEPAIDDYSSLDESVPMLPGSHYEHPHPQRTTSAPIPMYYAADLDDPSLEDEDGYYIEQAPLMRYDGDGSYEDFRLRKEEQEQRDREEKERRERQKE